MRESRVIEQNGVFLGAAVRLERRAPQGWRFVAVNGRVAALNGTQWPSLEELRQAAASGFARNRPALPAPVPISPAPLGPARPSPALSSPALVRKAARPAR